MGVVVIKIGPGHKIFHVHFARIVYYPLPAPTVDDNNISLVSPAEWLLSQIFPA